MAEKIYYNYYIAVKEEDTDLPIDGVNFTFDKKSGVTDSDGHCFFQKDTGLNYDTWYDIDSLGTIKNSNNQPALVSNIGGIVMGNTKRALILGSSGNDILTLSDSSNTLNSLGTYIVNVNQCKLVNSNSSYAYIPSSVSIGITHGISAWHNTGTTSFDKNTPYLSGEGTATFMIHNYKQEGDIKVSQIGTNSNSSYTIKKYPILCAYGYSYKSINEDEWATLNMTSDSTSLISDTSKKSYLSITLNANNKLIEKKISLTGGKTYKIKLKTYSAKNLDGIIVSKVALGGGSTYESPKNTSNNAVNDSNIVGKCTGINEEKTLTFTTFTNSVLFIYFITDKNSGLGDSIEKTEKVVVGSHEVWIPATGGGGNNSGIGHTPSNPYNYEYQYNNYSGNNMGHYETVIDYDWVTTKTWDGYTYGDVEICPTSGITNYVNNTKDKCTKEYSYTVSKDGYAYKSDTKSFVGTISKITNNDNDYYVEGNGKNGNEITIKKLPEYAYKITVKSSKTSEKISGATVRFGENYAYRDYINSSIIDEYVFDPNDSLWYGNESMRVWRYIDSYSKYKCVLTKSNGTIDKDFEYLQKSSIYDIDGNLKKVIDIDNHPIIAAIDPDNSNNYFPSCEQYVIVDCYERNGKKYIDICDINDLFEYSENTNSDGETSVFESYLDPNSDNKPCVSVSKSGYKSYFNTPTWSGVSGSIGVYNSFYVSLEPNNSICVRLGDENYSVAIYNVTVNIYSSDDVLYGQYLTKANGYIPTLPENIYSSNYYVSVYYANNSTKKFLNAGDNIIYISNISVEKDENVYDTFDRESINGIKKLLTEGNSMLDNNQKSKNISYNSDDFRINIVDPDSVNVYDIFTSEPIMINHNQKEVIGSVDTCLKPDLNDLRIKIINRYSGYYNPIFKDVLFYENFSGKTKVETDDGFENVSFDLPFSNTSFDYGYEDNQGKFGVIKNMWFHKVNNNRKIKIIKTITPYYPLIGQYALDYRDYNIFESNWDKDHYTIQVDVNKSKRCRETVSMKDGLCMFGSKYLNVPDEIEICGFNLNESSNWNGEWNDDWIKIPEGCPGEFMVKELNNNSVNYYFFFKKRILRYFREKLKQVFEKYINSGASFGKPGLDDDIDEYVTKNILKLYKLEKVRVFVRRTKVGNNRNVKNEYKKFLEYIVNTSDGSLTNISNDFSDFISYFKQHGFVEIDNINMTKLNRDDFDRKIVYNLRNGYMEEFTFSFILKKI